MQAGAGIVALPMYDWPEAREATNREWAALRARFHADGLDAPENLVRRNADLPPVPGGIRGPDGHAIAPDPATLPPDELDLGTLWRHPALLVAQTCWGPMEGGLSEFVTAVGQPDYSAFEGGAGALYSSAILGREGLPSPLRGGAIGAAERSGGPAPPHPGTPAPSLRADPPRKGEGKALRTSLEGKRLAFNGPDSMSGLIALQRDLEDGGQDLSLFTERTETGSHRASIRAVAEGRADVCAVDCRTWHLAQQFEPAAKALTVLGWTTKRKGLPYVTSRHTPPETVAALRAAVI